VRKSFIVNIKVSLLYIRQAAHGGRCFYIGIAKAAYFKLGMRRLFNLAAYPPFIFNTVPGDDLNGSIDAMVGISSNTSFKAKFAAI
jgi:hypothetical protein